MKLPASSSFSNALMRIRESLLFAFMFILPSVVLILANTQMLLVNADGVYANLGTADAADGSNDAINFSQGRVWTIDNYGKYIWLTQERSTPSSHWAWSNDLGANWTQGAEGYTFLTRASVAYDENNDKLHVIWAATDCADGIIYRRYGITRDGSNNITAIAREDAGNINLQLNTATSGNILEQPVALWLDDGSTNGSLVAIWSVRIDGGSDVTEIRGSMRQLSLSAADGVAGNWKALDGSGDVFAVEPPAVAADKIYGVNSLDTAAASAIIRGGAGTYKDDLYVFVAETEGTDSILAYRAAWNAANDDWSNGWQAPISVGDMGTSGSGYGLKYQLITKPVLDPDNDRLYIGWARWKDITDGDTVSFAYLSTSNAVSQTYDVYSAMGTHAYAPTLDIAYDSELDRLFVSYIESTTNGSNGSIYYVEFDGATVSAPTVFYTSPGGADGADGGADIPVLFERRSSNNRLLFAFRVNGALPPTGVNPHEIYWGYASLPSVTPSPTVTPTATSTPTPTATSTPVPSATPTVTNTPVPGSVTATPTSTGVITPTVNPTLEPTEVEEEDDGGVVSLPETGEEEDQGGVTITFVDKDDNPVSGAIVEIEGESYVTDESGQITLDLAEGDYRARVAYDGKSFNEKFSVLGTDNEELQVTLQKSSLLPVLIILAALSGFLFLFFKKREEDTEQKNIK